MMSKIAFYFNYRDILIPKSDLDGSIIIPLVCYGVVTVKDLVFLSAKEIRNIAGIDEEKIVSIRQYLRKFPSCLKGEEATKWENYDEGVTYEELGLRTSVINNLCKAGVMNPFELSLLTKDEVLRINSIGRTSILEIENALSKVGIKFRTDSCMKRQ